MAEHHRKNPGVRDHVLDVIKAGASTPREAVERLSQYTLQTIQRAFQELVESGDIVKTHRDGRLTRYEAALADA